jgi:hypothetical protein
MEAALRSLAPRLWVADRPLRTAPMTEIGARMTVVQLADGGLLLHSPVRLDEPTRAALERLGPVRHVVAPNRVHHLFVGDYVAAYPAARFHAAPGLDRKRADLKFHAVLGDDAPPEWAGELAQHLFRGAPYLSEVVFLHRASRTLVLTDLAFNVPAGRTSGARLFYWLVGAEGRFAPHRLVRFLIRDRAAARGSLDTILGWDFDRVVVSHGDVLETGGRERLAAGFTFL